jgi:NADPH:quinone reductase-like Zn-dependent oxidoreductase
LIINAGAIRYWGLAYGGNREYMPAPEYAVIPIPDNLSFEEAAAAPLVFVTAWHMLFTRAELQAGEDVLVLAASSGVGMAAVQLAKLFHCRVIATAGGDAKLAKAKALGADYVIDHYRQDISAEVKGTLGELHCALKFVFQGKLKPVIDRAYPMSEITGAHQRLENKEQFGKVVVIP